MARLDAQVGALLLDRTDSLVWATDATLRIDDVRATSLRQPHLDAQEVVSRTMAAHHRALMGEGTDLDYEWSDRIYEVHVHPRRASGGAIVGSIGVARDVTALRRAERMIAWQASHDALTGLPNRMALRERLSLAILEARRDSRPLSLLILDVDALHSVNDASGQEAGDALLRVLAKRVEVVAGPEAFVARMDGDALAVITTEPARPMAEAICALMAAPVAAAGREFLVTASIGMARFPEHGGSADHLIRAAEAAQRRVSDLGGNHCMMSSADLTVAAAERLGIEARLRLAIENRELSLAYQPQVRVSDGALLGLEALLRWRCDGELLSAASFIRAVEESAVIIDVGEWVILEACRQLREWTDAGIAPPRLAVNIGARHFQHPGFLGTVRRAIQRYGINSQTLEIEITETTAMHNAEATARLIDDLRALGVQITIDDFGTGYSSLAYLKRFAITGVKIDRSFVNDLPSSRSASAIVKAILAMAHALDLRVVAEGVEDLEQAEFLAAAGCDEAQGYWFGRPMRVEDVETQLRALGE